MHGRPQDTGEWDTGPQDTGEWWAGYRAPVSRAGGHNITHTKQPFHSLDPNQKGGRRWRRRGRSRRTRWRLWGLSLSVKVTGDTAETPGDFLDSITQYSTVQYSTVQYNTIQYNTVQYNTIQYSTVQYSTIQYSQPPSPRTSCRQIP